LAAINPYVLTRKKVIFPFSGCANITGKALLPAFNKSLSGTLIGIKLSD